MTVNPEEYWLPMLRWHLESNFYPPYDSRLAEPCLAALTAVKEGDLKRIITINGIIEMEGEPLIAEKLVRDFHLEPLLR
jgi:hypothetical protein